MSDHTFPKSLRLTNKKKFDLLFEEGKIVKAFPLKLIYIIEPREENSEPFQVAFTAPKRSFKKAVDRNHIKRRMREAFRLNQKFLWDHLDLETQGIYGILIYTNREKMDYHEIAKSWKKVMLKLVDQVNS